VSIPNCTDVFRRKGWLSKTPEDFQNAVLARCQVRKFKAGAPIHRMGDTSTGLFGLHAGRISVEIAPGERGPYLAFFAEPGAWVGYQGVVSSLSPMASLRATRDSETLFLSVQAIDDLIGEEPARWRIFAGLSFADLRTVASLLDDVTRRDHLQRVVAILLQWSGCRLATPPDTGRVELDVGQDEVARIANVGRTAAGAALRRLEKDGHIELAYRHIRILAPDELRAQLDDR
jgi:CRP/FNR family cyclic AMP-dependent transcriptional regulator